MSSSMRVILTALIALFLVTSGCSSQQAGDAPQSQSSETVVVASINGEPITKAELEYEAQGLLRQLDHDRYRMLEKGLKRMVNFRLIDAEAAERGVTSEALVHQEITLKITEPTQQEIADYYRDNNRLAERTLEEMSERIYERLKQTKEIERRAEFLDELRAKNEIVFSFEAPRYEIPVTEDDLARGPENAPLTVIEYADFDCPYCKTSYPVVERLLGEYAQQIRYVYRDFPLASHPRAVPAAMAAHCAGDQDKYWDYSQHLMLMRGDLSDADLTRRASDVGVDMAEFKACYEASRHEDRLQANMESGNRLGITGTPTFFINGRILIGAKPYEELKAVLDQELARIGE